MEKVVVIPHQDGGGDVLHGLEAGDLHIATDLHPHHQPPNTNVAPPETHQRIVAGEILQAAVILEDVPAAPLVVAGHILEAAHDHADITPGTSGAAAVAIGEDREEVVAVAAVRLEGEVGVVLVVVVEAPAGDARAAVPVAAIAGHPVTNQLTD